MLIFYSFCQKWSNGGQNTCGRMQITDNRIGNMIYVICYLYSEQKIPQLSPKDFVFYVICFVYHVLATYSHSDFSFLIS